MCMDFPAGLHIFFTGVKHALTQLPRGARSNSPSHILEVSEHISPASAKYGGGHRLTVARGCARGRHIQFKKLCENINNSDRLCCFVALIET